jgi:hypothetical protein
VTVHLIALHFTGIAMVACGRNRTRRIRKSAAFGGDSVHRNGAPFRIKLRTIMQLKLLYNLLCSIPLGTPPQPPHPPTRRNRRRKTRQRLPHIRPASLRTAIVRNAISRINPISVTSCPSTSAFATIASSRQHRSASGGASRIHRAVRKTMSAHLLRCRAMTLCNR